MSAKTFIASLAILGLASAQSSVISVFIPDTDPQPLVASIMGNDATATTYFLTCPAGTDGSDCGMGPGMTYFTGPKTVGLFINEAPDLSGGIYCSIGPVSAVCTTSMSGSGANDPGVSSETMDVTALQQGRLPVTVTAGSITPVSAPASATTTGATTSTSGAPSTAATTSAGQASKTSGSSTLATSASSSSSSSSSTKASNTAVGAASKGAGSQITANAKLVMGLGGAIVAGVVAAM